MTINKNQKNKEYQTLKINNIKLLVQSKNSSKGITLIALVITIIVLLILAGVTIAMLTGENGILTKAESSSNETLIAKEKEQIKMAYSQAKIEKLTNTNTEDNEEEITDTDMKTQFNINNITNISEVKGIGTIEIIYNNGNSYTIVVGGGGEIIQGKVIPEKPKTMLYQNGQSSILWNTPVPNRNSNWSTPLSVIFEDSYIKFYEKAINTSWISCGIVSAQKQDITKYSSLKIEYEVVEPTKAERNGERKGEFLLIQISDQTSFDYTSTSSSSTSTKGKFNKEIDISSMKGEKYIKIFTYQARGDGYTYPAYDSDVRITKIWLEE